MVVAVEVLILNENISAIDSSDSNWFCDVDCFERIFAFCLFVVVCEVFEVLEVENVNDRVDREAISVVVFDKTICADSIEFGRTCVTNVHKGFTIRHISVDVEIFFNEDRFEVFE